MGPGTFLTSSSTASVPHNWSSSSKWFIASLFECKPVRWCQIGKVSRLTCAGEISQDYGVVTNLVRIMGLLPLEAWFIPVISRSLWASVASCDSCLISDNDSLIMSKERVKNHRHKRPYLTFARFVWCDYGVSLGPSSFKSSSSTFDRLIAIAIPISANNICIANSEENDGTWV